MLHCDDFRFQLCGRRHTLVFPFFGIQKQIIVGADLHLLPIGLRTGIMDLIDFGAVGIAVERYRSNRFQAFGKVNGLYPCIQEGAIIDTGHALL